jgi:hypothetical protein
LFCGILLGKEIIFIGDSSLIAWFLDFLITRVKLHIFWAPEVLFPLINSLDLVRILERKILRTNSKLFHLCGQVCIVSKWK